MTVDISRPDLRVSGKVLVTNADGSSVWTDQDNALAALEQQLLDTGLCDLTVLKRAQHVAADTGSRFDLVLVQLGLLTERNLADAYVKLSGLSLAISADFPIAPLFPERLKAKFLRKSRCLPIVIADSTLILAMVDPLDLFVRDAVSAATGMAVSVQIAVPIELETALDRLYGDNTASETIVKTQEALSVRGNGEDAERLRDLASDAPVIKLVTQIIARAVETQASDIHLEPFEDRFRLRYRYDGVLHDADPPPRELGTAVTSRIKIMAHLDIAERRLPQDGRLRFAVRGQEVDFRISTVPSLFGETVVMRVLDRTSVAFDYELLGLPEALTAELKRLLLMPSGMILVTGPTGSGKTTTLYTALSGLNSEARKIVTIEDPIEYQLHGINQIQVKPQIGLNFASLLRSILRQDPDVIMIGEIRDLETAQIAAQAALTGHLVLSTLHTNSAAASITRLREMGLEDYLIAAVVKGIVAQRLVRRLCSLCARTEPASPELMAKLWPGHVEPVSLYHPVGCAECRGTGFRGRFALAELLVPRQKIEQLILSRGDRQALEAAAMERGMIPLLEAGLRAVQAGVTSLDELMRAVNTEG